MVWTIASPFSFQAQSLIDITYLSMFRVKAKAHQALIFVQKANEFSSTTQHIAIMQFTNEGLLGRKMS
jgi:hypothetical protein